MNTNPLRAALYPRVSTVEQARFGYSLPAQEDKLREYANYKGYEIVKVYKDELSGKNLERPEIRALISDIKAGKIDIVIIYKLDRLSRKVKDVLTLVELFEKYNVTLYSLTENIDVSSPFGRAALKMSATFSELERETIIERMLFGKEQRNKQGLLMYNGRPPLGYEFNEKTKRYEIIPSEAEIVRKIFDLYNSGMSIRKVHDFCKGNYDHPFFKGNNMSCRAILKRSMYMGWFEWNGERFKGENFDPIISPETYYFAQEKMKKSDTSKLRENSPYLLTGLLLCGECGNKYVGKYWVKSYKTKGGPVLHETRGYGCAARVKRDKTYHPAKCENRIYAAKELEEKIETAIINFEFTDENSDFSPSTVIDAIMEQNATYKKQIDKLLDLYLEDYYDKDTLDAKVGAIQNKIDDNDKALKAMQERERDKLPVSVEYLRQKQKEFPTAPLNEKRLFVQTIIKSIIIERDDITIKWRIK